VSEVSFLYFPFCPFVLSPFSFQLIISTAFLPPLPFLPFRYVEDIVRSTVPKMELDSAFEAKEELAHAIRDSLQQTMGSYG